MDEQDHTDTESVSSELSQFAPDQDEFPGLNVIKGPLSEEEMVRFLKSVKMSKRADRVARNFTTNIPGLVKQLKSVRNNPILLRRQQRRVSTLIKRLDPDNLLSATKHD